MTLFSKENRQERKDIRLVRTDGMRLKDVENQTDKVVIEAFKKSGPDIVPFIKEMTIPLYLVLEDFFRCRSAYPMFRYIPEEKLTQELCLEAVKYSLLCFDDVPEKFRTYAVYKEYVEHSGMGLKDIPKEHITYEMCVRAVRDNGAALEYVPEEFRTEDVCRKALSMNYWKKDLLPFVCNQTEELCLLAVEKDGMFLQSVKEQTDAICLAAVKKDGLALEFVENQTKEICFEAVAKNPKALMYVKDKELAQLAAAYAQSIVREK